MSLSSERRPRRGRWDRLARELGRQQITRVPPARKGDRVRLGELPAKHPQHDLSDKTLVVQAVTAVLPADEGGRARWLIHLPGGRCVDFSPWVKVIYPRERADD